MTPTGCQSFHVGHVAHALLFEQIAQAGQHFHAARDDLVEQVLQLIAGGGARFLEDRFALSASINPVEHQTMQMDVQVGGRAKSLDEGDRAGVGCGAFHACLLEQKPRDNAVDDAQHRREQFGLRDQEYLRLKILTCMLPAI